MNWQNWTILQPDKLIGTPNIYIGCMTGTSADQNADFTAAIFADNGLPIAYCNSTFSIPEKLHVQLLALTKANRATTLRQTTCIVENQLTAFLSDAFIDVIAEFGLNDYPADRIILSPHGQALDHQPTAEYYYTDIIVNGAILAQTSGYKTVTQHRQAALAVSMAAPLAPVLIRKLFYSKQHNVIVLNGGGIANIAALFKDDPQQIIGYDTGPANAPIDAIVQHIIETIPNVISTTQYDVIRDCGFDKNGTLAKSGKLIPELKNALLQHNYFNRPIKQKSTDRSQFGLSEWILPCINQLQLNNASWLDILATVTRVVADSISLAVKTHIQISEEKTDLILYGGIIHNDYLIELIKQNVLTDCDVNFINMHDLDYNPDFFESLLMAYLGFCAHNKIAIDLNYCARDGVRQAFAVPGVVAYPAHS